MNISCDANTVNLFFLKQQHKIVVHKKNGYEFLYYHGTGSNRNGWLLPQDISSLTHLLQLDSSPHFILLTQEQCNILTEWINKNACEYKITFNSDEGDSDYIYGIEKMANLPGKAFQKKRNHVSRFLRTYEKDWKFEFLNSLSINNQLIEAIKKIYQEWLAFHGYEDNEFLVSEKKSVEFLTQTDNFKMLKLIGGVLFAKGRPDAFAIASFTTPECLNVHFEKCLSEPGDNGGLAVLNQKFAQAVLEQFPQCKFLNREEDLNVPGLRKSKLSYNPEFLLNKYYGTLEILKS